MNAKPLPTASFAGGCAWFAWQGALLAVPEVPINLSPVACDPLAPQTACRILYPTDLVLVLPPNERRTTNVGPLLQNSKAQADTLLEQQQVFEEALARNDATHEARLRRLKLEAEERSARQAETATVSVAAASAAAIGAHGRQAGAAVAAMAAAGVHAQTQQASAMAAQAAMFLEFQVCRSLSFLTVRRCGS